MRVFGKPPNIKLRFSGYFKPYRIFIRIKIQYCDRLKLMDVKSVKKFSLPSY